MPNFTASNSVKLNSAILAWLRKNANVPQHAVDTQKLLPVRLHHIGGGNFISLNQFNAPLGSTKWVEPTRVLSTLGLYVETAVNPELAPSELAPNGYRHYCLKPTKPILDAYSRVINAAKPTSSGPVDLLDVLPLPRIRKDASKRLIRQ